MTLPSRNQINRCGEYLVDIERNGFVPERHTYSQFIEAHSVLDEFRGSHQDPTNKVTLGLRSMVKTATGKAPVVSQRLKRAPRIVRKLARLERSMLARLEDIGGCRAVVENPADMEKVRRRIERNWGKEITRRRDYVATSNEMGYRALHFTVRRDDRLVEVQIRTRGQQQWANEVEKADARLKLTLKDGVGPESMLEYFRALGAYIFAAEYGLPSAELRTLLTAAEDRVIAEGFYTGRSS